jgi:hypothetical protein
MSEQELNKDQLELLNLIAKDTIKDLDNVPDIRSSRQLAFEYFSKETKEIFQVQIVVSRDESDRLEPFQSEYTS